MTDRSFLHALSLDDGGRTLIPTTGAKLRAQSFLDGRSDFSTGPAVWMEGSQARPNPPAPPPDRYIFHVGFCGSTLLARLLDQPGRALVLREPNCLADLANQADRPSASSHCAVTLDEGLTEIRSQLRRGWQGGEPVVVKPSNWVNRLLPDFAAQPAAMRALFMTIDRPAFVRAIVRGGSDRLGFIARAALHFSNADDRFPPLVAKALGWRADGPARLLALAAAAHEMQLRLMRQAAARWPDSASISLRELTADPFVTAARAAKILGLSLDEARLSQDCRHWAGRHAKAPANAFSPEAEASARVAIEAELGSLLDETLEWASVALGD